VDGTSELTHLIWCDNVWLFASNKAEMCTMIAELTEAIHAGGFRWKPTSLQVMAGGDATAEDLSDVSCFDADGSVLRFSCVDHMIVLGEYIDSEASTLPSLSYRLSKAEANY
jgi:hypothetical protein